MSYPRTPTTTTSAATTTPNATPTSPTTHHPGRQPSRLHRPFRPHPSRITHPTRLHSPLFATQDSGPLPGPPPRRENGGAAVRDADPTVMPMSSCRRLAPGTTDRNCRLLLEHAGQTL